MTKAPRDIRLGKLEAPRAGAWPLTAKFTLVLLVAALLPMLLVAYGSLRGSLAGVAETERANLALVASGLARQLEQLVYDNRLIAQLLADDPDTESFLSAPGDPARRGRVDRRMRLLKGADPRIANLYLLDRHGVFVASTNAPTIGQRRDFRDYFQRAMTGEPYASNLLVGVATDESGVYFSAPIRDRTGAIAGVAMAKVRGEAFSAILRGIDRAFTAFLVDRDGIVIDHPDPRWLHRSVRPVSAEKMAEIQARSHFPVDTLRPLGIDGLAPLSGSGGQGGNLSYVDSGRERWELGYAPLKTHLWTVAVAEPESRFAAPLNRLFDRSILLVGAMGAAVLALAIGLGRAMARPIVALTNTARSLERGDYLDALAHPDLAAVSARRDELGGLARVFHGMGEEIYRREFQLDQQVQARTRELAEKNAQLEATHRRVEEELRLSRAMQLAILPQHFPDEAGWAVAASMFPAREMGGDFYDCFALRDGRYGLVVADVSGKGIPAAFFMAVSRTVLLDTASRIEDPAAVLARANDLLCERNPLELFVTVFYAVFDPRNGSLSYACAGHNPPLLRRTGGTVVALPCPHDTALGVLPGLDYHGATLRLEPGETLVLFSDGVTEAFSGTGEAFGDERLRIWLASASGTDVRALVDGLVDQVSRFIDGAEASDDLTCLVLCRRSPPAVLDYTMPSRLEEIARLAEAVEDALHDRPKLAYEVNLCLEELLTNTIVHGLAGADDRRIHVRLECTDHLLEVVLEDDAPPFDPFADAPEPDLDADLDSRPIGGLGVHFVRTLMNETVVSHDNGGNRVILRKRL